jgi:hypothetical protein
MRTSQAPLDDVGSPGIFNLIAKALMVQPWESEPFQRATQPAKAPASRLGLLERVDRWCWRLSQRAVEEHLGRSRDVYELEARIRELERGVPFRCY